MLILLRHLDKAAAALGAVDQAALLKAMIQTRHDSRGVHRFPMEFWAISMQQNGIQIAVYN